MKLHQVSHCQTCFNSRTREGATRGLCAVAGGIGVSIHAPVRVRLFELTSQTDNQVSIHAPVRVRHKDFVYVDLICMFQFTHP